MIASSGAPVLRRVSPLLLVMVSATALGVAVVAVVTAWRVPGLSATSDSVVATVLVLSAAATAVAVGLEHVRRGRQRDAGALLATGGVLWLLSEWANPSVGSSLAFTVGLSLGWLWPAVLAHAVLAFAGGVARPPQVAVLAVAYAAFGIGLGLVPALTFDAAAIGCGFCPPDLIVVATSKEVFDAAMRVGAFVGATALAATGVLLLANLIGRPPSGRRRQTLLIVPAVLFMFAVATDVAGPVILRSAGVGDAHMLRLAESALLAALAAGASVAWIRIRRSRIRVARVVAELSHSPPAGGLRAAFASTLGDPDLRLAYPLPDGDQVDSEGRAARLDRPIAEGRVITPIAREGEVVALLDHRADVFQGQEMVEEVIRAARLGLEHERLHALARAQLAALTAARKRIVAAAAAERRRLEHDLHDGAQQRLIAIAVNLRLLASDAFAAEPRAMALIAEAGKQIGVAIEELREVAHGLYPTVLADEGFAAAIEGLTEGATVPVRMEPIDVDPLDAPIAEAAYSLVAESVSLGRGSVEVRATRTDGVLKLEVDGPDLPADVLLDLADRIGAVDGTLTATRRSAGRTHLLAEIPCAS